MKRIVPVLLLWAALWSSAALAAPYQPQAPTSALGRLELTNLGPPGFVRIDGLDRSLDQILLATQSPSAAVLALFAEPKAWRAFQAGSRQNDQTGLSCHALLSTPAPLAAEVVPPKDFERIKKDLVKNLSAAVKKERRLEGELAHVSDHQVEWASGVMESFTIIQQAPEYITYRLESTLKIKLKNVAAPRLSHSSTLSTTMLVGGKIINLQLVADPQGPSPAALEETARQWRDEFHQTNQPPR